MGWQAAEDPRPDGVPGSVVGRPGLPELPELLAGFAHGGDWEATAPCAVLAAALEAVAGTDGLYEGAGTDELVGIAGRWAAIESWAAAELLGTLRVLGRDADPALARPGLPDGWDDSLVYELSAALAMGPVSAGNLAALAWALGTRLPLTGRLLADGTLSRAKAKLIAAVFDPLDDQQAARAEALIAGEVPGKTYPQVERLAWRAALAIAPDTAERRRKAAERNQARVTVFREESGAAGLSGRDLPAAQALSGHARVLDRAREYAASGAFPGEREGHLEALAYLHLLNGVSAADAIAFARTEANGTSGPGDDGQSDRDGREDGDPEDSGPGPGPRSGPGPKGGDDAGGKNWPAGPAGRARLPQVTIPLATLLGLAEHPGENRLLGPFDPALARDLATAAARSPATRWEITVTDPHGHTARLGTPRRSAAPPTESTSPGPPGAFTARVNITVTEALLRRLAAQSLGPPRRPGSPRGTWLLTPRTPGDPDGPWQFTLPGGRQLTVRFDEVPVHDCDHRYQAGTYLPGDRLRRLVSARDHECTFPTCSRPAHQCDFEHATPHDQGGATCTCNAGARSRRCHRVKQASGWTLTQPQPGYHQWTTPTGRTYTQEPWRYPA
jgi:hypothetical protein